MHHLYVFLMIACFSCPAWSITCLQKVESFMSPLRQEFKLINGSNLCNTTQLNGDFLTYFESYLEEAFFVPLKEGNLKDAFFVLKTDHSSFGGSIPYTSKDLEDVAAEFNQPDTEILVSEVSGINSGFLRTYLLLARQDETIYLWSKILYWQ